MDCEQAIGKVEDSRRVEPTTFQDPKMKVAKKKKKGPMKK